MGIFPYDSLACDKLGSLCFPTVHFFSDKLL